MMSQGKGTSMAHTLCSVLRDLVWGGLGLSCSLQGKMWQYSTRHGKDTVRGLWAEKNP